MSGAPFSDSTGGGRRNSVVDTISTVAWVHGELRRSLEAAHKFLRRHLKEAEGAGRSDIASVDPALLRHARSQVHQGVGALDLVGFREVATVLRASEAALLRLANRPSLLDMAALDTFERASFAVLDLLQRELSGKPVSAVVLFPQYRALQQLAGADRVHPADLWRANFNHSPLAADPSVQARASDETTRDELEAYVLGLMRQPSLQAYAAMSALCAQIAAGVSPDRSREAVPWHLAAAVFEAQSVGLLGQDVYTKRLASRLLAQLRMTVRGQREVSDALALDLLFFCANSAAPTPERPAPRLAAVRRAWSLEAASPIDYETPRLGRFDPALTALARKRVAAAKDSWQAAADGDLNRAMGLSEQFALVGDSLARLFPHGDVLAQALQSAVTQTLESGQAPAAPLAMEVATGLLYLDASIEDGTLDHPELGARVRRLARRMDDARIGVPAQPLEPWMEELYRRVSDRQTMGSVVQELRSSLGEVEKLVDQFFRQPDQHEGLAAVPRHLLAMRGVLSVLGLDDASRAVLHLQGDVARLAGVGAAQTHSQEATQRFDRVAENLGALSFLIDLLSVQPSAVKSLFHFDNHTGLLSTLMAPLGRAAGATTFSALRQTVPQVPVATAATAVAVTAAAASAAAAAAAAAAAPAEAPNPISTEAAPSLPLSVAQLRQAALEPAVSLGDIEQQLERLAQRAVLAEQTALARVVSDTQFRLRRATDDHQRLAVREELARALVPFAPQAPQVDDLEAPSARPASARAPTVAVPEKGTDWGNLPNVSMDAVRLAEPSDAGAAEFAAAPTPTPAPSPVPVPVPEPVAALAAAPHAGSSAALVPPVDALLPEPRLAMDATPAPAHPEVPLAAASHGAAAVAGVAAAAAAGLGLAAHAAGTTHPQPPLSPAPAPAPESMPAPAPAAAPAVALAFADDDEMRGVFFEEAREVMGEAAAALRRLQREPQDPADMSALRRAFHTLKGSSRMVGLADFGEAAWSCEQLYNARLAQAPAMDPPLVQFTNEALRYLGDWVEALAAGRSDGHRIESISRPALALRQDSAVQSGWVPTPQSAELPEPPEPPLERTSRPMPLFDDTATGPAKTSVPVGFLDVPVDDESTAVAANHLAAPLSAPDLSPNSAFSAFSAFSATSTLAERVPGLPQSSDLDLGAPVQPLVPSTEPQLDWDFSSFDEQAHANDLLPTRTPEVSEGDLDWGPDEGFFATQPVPTADSQAMEWSDEEMQRVFDTVPGASLVPNAPVPAPLPASDVPVTLAGHALRKAEHGDDAEDAVDADDEIDWADTGADGEQFKAVGSLRIPIPLFNIFLNEADEHSRRLANELAEWAVQAHEQPLPAHCVSLAHSLAGNSATVGYLELSSLARALENTMAHVAPHTQEPMRWDDPEDFDDQQDLQALDGAAASDAAPAPKTAPLPLTHGEPALFVEVAEEIRRLLHQFAAGFLRPVGPGFLERLAACDALLPPEPAAVEAPGATLAPAPAPEPTLAPSLAPALALAPVAVVAVAATATATAAAAAAAAPVSESISKPAAPALDASLAPSAFAPLQVPADHASSGFDRAGLEGEGSDADRQLDAEIDAVDSVDEELFPIFSEEANELLPQLQNHLRRWHEHAAQAGAGHAAEAAADPSLDSAHENPFAAACMRSLHTFKGGARLAGAMRLGELAHRLESAVERVAARPHQSVSDVDPLVARADHLSLAFERLCAGPQTLPPATLRSVSSLAAPAALMAPLALAATFAPSAPAPQAPAIAQRVPPAVPVVVPAPAPTPVAAPVAAPVPMPAPFGSTLIERAAAAQHSGFGALQAPVETDRAPAAMPVAPLPPAVPEVAAKTAPAEAHTTRAAVPAAAEASAAGAMSAAPSPAPTAHLSAFETATPAHQPSVSDAAASPAAAAAAAATDAPAAATDPASSGAAPRTDATGADPAPRRLLGRAGGEVANDLPINWAHFEQALAGTEGAASVPARALPGEREAALAASQAAAVRVRAGLLDRLVSHAGEVSITRERMAVEMRTLQNALGEMTDSLERMRRQLRDIEVQAETQINSRMETARASGQNFDPLEMDRFTRFQELTRFMAESVNDVGTLQRTLQRTLQATEDELASQARLTRELQDDLLRTRMVEFESLADRLYRTVRQAAKDTGKQVRLDIVGGGIEIDRGVLERMVGSFEHLLRNCVAHGVESPAARTAAGKETTGRIVVQVTQSGNEVAVEVGDDGAGFDYARIRQRAIERGLLAPTATATNEELAQFLFNAGFSTASAVNELAGRGVGLDVVRAEVMAMGGRIETSSGVGQGSRFRLLLPLTTAVTQVVNLRCGEFEIAVPSTLVEVVRRVRKPETEAAYASGQFVLDGQSMPFYWLPALLQAGTRGETEGRAQAVVVIRSADQRVAVHVDQVLGNQEVVVKNVGPQLARLPGLVGVTLLPSGAVALIYNPVALAAVYAGDAQSRMRQPTRPAGAQVPQAALAPMVLVVDDSLTVRRVTQRLLVREGYRVVTAKDGLEALERLAEERPTLLLSDIEMPRMDGFDLVRNVRTDPRLVGLPVVMITSRIAQKHRDYALELGVDHYLGKPYSEEELLTLVETYARKPMVA